MRRLLILVAALALLTTACKIEINAQFVIEADKSGQVVLEIGFDDDVLALAQGEGASLDDMLSDFDMEDVPGAVTTTERRGDMTFTIVTVPIDDYTTADSLGGEMTEGLSDNFQITFTDDLVTIRGSTTLDDALGEDGGEMEGLSPEAMAQFFSVNIKVTMPGRILDHNATSQAGNTLTWEVDLADGNIDIFAESDPNASEGSSTLLIVLIAAGVVLVGLLLWLFLRRKSGTPAEAYVAAPPAEDAAPPAPPPAE